MIRFDCMRKWVLEAGEKLRAMQEETLEISEKTGPQDIVTRCDKEIEQFLRGKIAEQFPEDEIVGEEFPISHGTRTDRVGKSGLASKAEDRAAERRPVGSGMADGRRAWAEGAKPTTAVWYIDPIDGTTNFVNQKRDYAVSVGCALADGKAFGIVLDVAERQLYTAKTGAGAWKNDRPIRCASREAVKDLLLLCPVVTELYLGEYEEKQGLLRLSLDVRAVRSIGSVALELCRVASGEADLCIALHSCPWDHNGARVILQEAGGALFNLSGEELPWNEPTTLFAGSSRHMAESVWREYLG